MISADHDLKKKKKSSVIVGSIVVLWLCSGKPILKQISVYYFELAIASQNWWMYLTKFPNRGSVYADDSVFPVSIDFLFLSQGRNIQKVTADMSCKL